MMTTLAAPTTSPVSPDARAPPVIRMTRAFFRPILSRIGPTTRDTTNTPIVAKVFTVVAWVVDQPNSWASTGRRVPKSV